MLEKRPPRSTDLPPPRDALSNRAPRPQPRKPTGGPTTILAIGFGLLLVICLMMALWRAAHDGRHVDQPAPTSIPPR